MSVTAYEHFTLERLAEGVHAAIANPDGAAGSNAGVVVLDDRTLVFDTFATVSAASELRTAVESLTDKPIKYVINSHVHPDHVHGNVVFAHDAIIIASAITYRAMKNDGIQRMERFFNQISQSVKSVEEQLAHTADPAQRDAAELQLATGRRFLAGFAKPEDYRLPHFTFQHALSFQGSNRTVKLIACGEGHSACDSVLFLPEERILFTADLVTDGDLVLRYGNPENWLLLLDRLEALNPTVIVPGHGRVLPGTALAETRRYLEQIMRDAQQAVRDGATADDADQTPVPAGRNDYWYRDNFRFLINRFRGA